MKTEIKFTTLFGNSAYAYVDDVEVRVFVDQGSKSELYDKVKETHEFIEKACNSYDEMLEALQMLVKEFEDKSVEMKTPIAYFKGFEKAKLAIENASK